MRDTPVETEAKVPPDNRIDPAVFWVAGIYFGSILALAGIVRYWDFCVIQNDAQVHRIMTSSPNLTVEQVAPLLKNIGRLRTPMSSSPIVYDIGSRSQRQLLIEFDLGSRQITNWTQFEGEYSKVNRNYPVDTLDAATGGAYLGWLQVNFIIIAITLSPPPFWLAARSKSNSPSRIAMQLASVPFALLSACVGLFMAVELMTYEWF
jgi:hypothetical protein